MAEKPVADYVRTSFLLFFFFFKNVLFSKNRRGILHHNIDIACLLILRNKIIKD